MDTSLQGNSVHWPRNNKYYFTSPGDYYNNLGHSSHTSPVNFWPGFPNNNANFGKFSTPPLVPQNFAHFGNYPQMGNFYQPHVAQGYTAVPNSFHPPPYKAQSGANVTNPFSVSNLQTRPVVPEEV